MKKVLDELFALRDEGYRAFTAKLTPSLDEESIIGVRTPALRAYARRFSKEADAHAFLDELPHRYYEENNLHSALISLLFKDIDSAMSQVERFLPYVDNWATCDALAPKLFKRHTDIVYPKITEWITSANLTV